MTAMTSERLIETGRGLSAILTWARRVRPSTGLSATAFTTLDTLAYLGPLRISELAEREGITQPGMTGLINRLENDGLAVRTADPSDGRAALVDLTDAGRNALDAHRTGRAELIAHRIANLDPADQAALVAALPAIDRLTADLSGRPVLPAGYDSCSH